VTTPNLFTSPEDPAGPVGEDIPTAAVPAPRRRRRRWTGPIGAAVVGTLLVAGVVVIMSRGGGEAPPRVGTAGAPTTAPGRPAERAGAGGRPEGGLGADTLLVGSVVSASPDSLVVAQDGGPQRTVRPDAQTRLLGAGARSVTDLRPGDRVAIRVAGVGDAATAVTVRTPKAQVTGTVMALSGDTAALLEADGMTVGVDLTAVSPKPAVGDLVRVTGRATGATLIADRIRTLPKTG
jgi:hypothetical protein